MKTASGKEQDTRPQIREPQQKRAIEKKEKIIQACVELVSEKGYRSTTTVDIAKRAGVSTGIVYSYFKDKKEFTDNAKIESDKVKDIWNRTYNARYM